MKKTLVVFGALIGAVIILLVAAGIVVMLIVDKSFIESRLSPVLHRQVTIEAIDVSIFSLVSGMEIKKMTISNFKTPEELISRQGKPIASEDVFASMEALRFKIRFLPLLRKQLELKELVLYAPVVNLARNKKGALNCSDLLGASKEQTAQPSSSEVKKDESGKNPAKPVSADDIPIAVSVGEVGLKNATVNYYDGKFEQKFQIYNLTTLAYDINIDPTDLKNKDEIKVKIAFGLKTVGPVKTGSVQSFDITVDAAGRVIPFDIKTRQLEPEIILHAAFPEGRISGLQIFNAVAAVPLLGDYLGEHLSFLKGKVEWKNSRTSSADLHYKAGRADISNGSLDLQEARLLFAGMVQTDSQALDMNLNMIMKKEINDSVKATLAKKIDTGIRSPEVKKYVTADQLAATALQPLINKEGLIDLQLKASGTTKNAEVKIVRPQLDSVDGVIKKAAGSVLMETGKGAAKKLIGEEKGKILENVFDSLKKNK
ncbi:MAG: AsmA family protein [Smithella sp. PtaU1.Bin162]|nr:MAG: AsmA family protein [Smithella sp. PtaU1.Bin162]